MKKTLLSLILVLAPLILSAQANIQIVTKKMKLDDFTTKTTKVVLPSGTGFYSNILQDEVRSKWRVSPYEFCTTEEFESLKGNDEYYFLVTVSGKFRKENEPGLNLLTLVKGGKTESGSIDDLLEIVTVPVCSVENPNGREAIFLGALLDIIQNHALSSMERNISAYGGLGATTSKLKDAQNKQIIIAEEDLSDEFGTSLKALFFKDDFCCKEADEADEYMLDNTPQTLVSYVAAPSDPQPGSYCYKMLIDAHTHELYYFKRHKITKKTGAGFLIDDIRRIAGSRK